MDKNKSKYEDVQKSRTELLVEGLKIGNWVSLKKLSLITTSSHRYGRWIVFGVLFAKVALVVILLLLG